MKFNDLNVVSESVSATEEWTRLEGNSTFVTDKELPDEKLEL
jgi:hypothetical protein